MQRLCFYVTVLAASLSHGLPEKRATSPSVSIWNGTIIGSSLGGIDSFKGIPFAQPPTKSLRLKPPQPITKAYGTITATGTPTACPQQSFQVDSSNLPSNVIGMIEDSPFFQKATVSGEDCLTLNIQRPSTAKQGSKLPVLFWIYGGGFEFGSTQMYDGSNIVRKSVTMGKDIIYVSTNYRVGGFGFLAGKELQKDGSTNLGLRDQRLAMQWVAENIATFGGDPSKVTLWGESAGSISVYNHLLINNGDNTYRNTPLFRSAIMDSGTATPALPVSNPKPQAIYNTVVRNAGCSTASDTLSCLRSKDYTTFLNAANSVPSILSYSSIDLSYLPRPDASSDFFSISPDKAGQSGHLARVPVIIGDQQDEGTIFALSQTNISTTSQLVDYLVTYFPGDAQAHQDVSGLVSTYPDSPSSGSPYNTGALYNIYPQYKRLAAILGDIAFVLIRRLALTQLTQAGIPCWSYLSTYFQGTPVVGTFHASDILEVYDDAPFPTPALSMQSYYVSFVNTGDPNGLGVEAPLIQWPMWREGRMLLDFGVVGNTLTSDTFREASYEFLVGTDGRLQV